MTTGIRVVAPFRPFAPETSAHEELADFDWIDAIRMLQASVEQSCRCPFHVLTDVDTDLPLPTLRYETAHRRLMLWYLEVSLRYLESDDFDRDTVSLDSDQLVYGDLALLNTKNADLVVCVRPDRVKQAKNPNAFRVLNGVQIWRRRGKARLVDFYRQALAIAERLPENRIAWGADTDALVALLAPIGTGLHRRAGLDVHMRDADTVIETCSDVMRKWMGEGRPFRPSRPVLDFRYRRKPFMRPIFEHTFGVTACAS